MALDRNLAYVVTPIEPRDRHGRIVKHVRYFRVPVRTRPGDQVVRSDTGRTAIVDRLIRPGIAVLLVGRVRYYGQWNRRGMTPESLIAP